MSKAERTREYIIEQIAPLFNKKGFAGTSMSDMSLATGLSKGAIYGNFKNKDALALAAFDYNMNQIQSTIQGMMKVLNSPLEKLMVFPKFYREVFTRKYMNAGCPVANGAPEADDTHPRLKKRINAYIKRWNRGIQLLVNEGIRSREIKADTDPAKIAAIIITQIEGGIMISKSTGDMSYLNATLDQVEMLITEIAL